MEKVSGKKITVLGAARSGVAAALLLKGAGATVFVSDSADANRKKTEKKELDTHGIPDEYGGHSERIYSADMVVLSPGISVDSPVVKEIRKREIPLFSEIEIASWFCKSEMIAVTGSNGKTTTTTLIGEMLKKKYPDAIVAGNIGQPFSEYVGKSHPAGWAVIEVSSFQLETIDTFHPKIVIVLNFAPNHLDRYRSYEEYIRAKWRITKNLTQDDLLIFNGNDIQLSDWALNLSCRKECFRLEIEDDRGAYYMDGFIHVDGKRYFPADEMIVRGKHNYMNAMAAILAARKAAVPKSAMEEVLRTFKGIEHRLEFVRELNGVRYYNDSKATTVESLYYALQSFSDPVILIAGGKDKGSDFTKLNELIAKHVKHVIVIGDASGKIETAWKSIRPVRRADSMEMAVKVASELARTNNVVLLSPACASFDMFENFEDRGDSFKKQVLALA